MRSMNSVSFHSTIRLDNQAKQQQNSKKEESTPVLFKEGQHMGFGLFRERERPESEHKGLYSIPGTWDTEAGGSQIKTFLGL